MNRPSGRIAVTPILSSALQQIPIYDADAAIACTIDAAEIPERIELIERMRANLERLERTEHGMMLHFPARPDIEADLRKFAADEKRCCQFWGFEVLAGDQLRFRWEAPPGANEIVCGFEAFFRGAVPASELIGFL